MPYIPEERRHALDPFIADLDGKIHENLYPQSWAGEINYVMSTLFKRVWERHGKSYWMFALMVGVLVTCALELYRRVIVRYETDKIIMHGDVYDDPL